MTARVPIARRALFQDRRRAALAAGGVAAALLLVLMLQGIWDGAIREATNYLRNSPAHVVVSQKGVHTMHMSVSALDTETPSRIEKVPGVAWVEPIRFATTALVGPGAKQQLAYVIGYDTNTGRAGPRHMTTGRPPRSGEIIVERVAAQRLGVGVGGDVQVFGTAFRVSGIFRGGTTIANSVGFITTQDFARARGDSYGYVFVGGDKGVSPEQLRARLTTALPNDTVMTRRQFIGSEAGLVKDMAADLMQIMFIVGFLIALAIVGLTLFTLTLSKLREHAIVKALGAGTGRLAAIVLAQAAWSVGLAVVTATTLALALGALVTRVTPAVAIAIEPRSVLRVCIAALLIGALGAVMPLRRVALVDPASAFRRAS